ncbi:MAG: hypothetical protein IAE82_08370 [Opitutaceae bacterium]|nr:hypothetical protein [Opitutaceae bacterium]
MWLLVAAAQLWFVARLGNDIPHWDQWGSEGRDLYPKWHDGCLKFSDLFRPHSEHRIAFTRALNLGLFIANQAWDPLVQLLVGVGLRALAATCVARLLITGIPRAHQWLLSAATAVIFLPLLAWENVLWGFQSQVTFSIILVTSGFALIAHAPPDGWRHAVGWLLTGLSSLAMGAGLTAFPALLFWLLLRLRGADRPARRTWLMLLGLAAVSALLFSPAPGHDPLKAGTPSQAIVATLRVLAWPHVGMPVATLATIAPILAVLGIRLARADTLRPGESATILLGTWALLLAAALAWSRGAGDAFTAVIPSRYIDFLMLLTISALSGLLCLMRSWPSFGRLRTAWIVGAWAVFITVGLVGVATETWRWVIGPRWDAPNAPAMRAAAFQTTGDPTVFAGVPRMFWPSPDLDLMQQVLHDTRLAGRLPPTFQPDRPPGPFGRGTRWILAHANAAAFLSILLALAIAWIPVRPRRPSGTTTPIPDPSD